MSSDSAVGLKKGLMLRPTDPVRAFLKKKKLETGVPISSWITMLIVKEMEKEANRSSQGVSRKEKT